MSVVGVPVGLQGVDRPAVVQGQERVLGPVEGGVAWVWRVVPAVVQAVME